jgi:NitT/TauT family transport system permease protein
MSTDAETATGQLVRTRPARVAGRPRRGRVLLAQIAILVGFLAAWQWLPTIDALSSRAHILDPFFISSPSQVATKVWEFLTGTGDTQPIWPYLAKTLEATLLGTAGGIIVGSLAGLVLSNSDTANAIFRPFIVAANAVPRVALIPVIVIVFGPTMRSSAISALLLVVFIVFFNAYEGGRNIAPEVLANARILGASPRKVMTRVRLPYVMAWVFAALPNAISFGLVGTVTTEILAGVPGMGRLLVLSINLVDATTTFAVVVILSVVGVVLVGLTSLARARLLRWWDKESAR